MWVYWINTILIPGGYTVGDALAGRTPTIVFNLFAGTALGGVFSGVLLLAGLSGQSSAFSVEFVDTCLAMMVASLFAPAVAAIPGAFLGAAASWASDDDEDAEARVGLLYYITVAWRASCGSGGGRGGGEEGERGVEEGEERECV